MTIAILTRAEFDKQYDELDETDVPVAVAMPNKAERREYSTPTPESIAAMKYVRDRIEKIRSGA